MVIAVFYGGKSCEHDVSVVTGVQTISALKGHTILPIYIKRDGSWHLVFNYGDFSAYKKGALKSKPAYIKAGDEWLYVKNKKWKKIDCAILCLHGAHGEDGCVQGALKISGIAYTGSGVLPSAVGLNKYFSKLVFEHCGLKVLPYLKVERDEYENYLLSVVNKVKKRGFPVVVKPNSLGSSIGVKLVDNAKELIVALGVAFEWDDEVLVESALTDFTELNLAVMGHGNAVTASMPERPLSYESILSYADKYERGGFKGEGEREFPAKISAELCEKVKEQAKRAFVGLGASGIARIDFLCKDEEVYINEINTIPGSLATYLFPDYEFNGKVGESAVLEKLIDLAIRKKQEKDRLSYRYDSPTLHGK